MRTGFIATIVCVLLGGCASERVVLLPGSDGHTGAVAVLNEDGSERGVLDQPYSQASVGAGSVKPTTVSEQSVQGKYGTLLGALPPAPRVFVLYFREDSTELVAASRPELDLMFAEVAARSGAEVQVTGHTDRLGKREDNDLLSLRRATAVRDMLIERGMQPELVRAVGRGEREPLVETDDEVEEPRNRRVEITVR
jgi:outer membrane protein OmpA-like peptidoglycan-associated protein